MANEQHIEWLLEGVAAWNARREKEDFIPDFEALDFYDAFDRAGKFEGQKKLRPYDSPTVSLHEVNLSNAKLAKADLTRTSLSGANLKSADLRFANLNGANLTGALVDNADCSGADLRVNGMVAASLKNVLVKTLADPESTQERTMVATNLDGALGLSQQDILDQMLGDSGTIIPDRLIRPDHWPELGNDDQVITEDRTEPTPQPAKQIALQDQVSIILATPVKHAAAAELLNDQLDSAIRMFRAANQTNEQPDDLILVEKFSDKLREIRAVLDHPGEAKAQNLENRLPELLAIIEGLRATIEDQAEQIETLKAQKPERTDFQKMRSAFAISFGTTLGAGTAAGILSAGDAILGNYGASTIQQLRDAFGSFFGATPPAPPPQLPPTTAV